jgi:hypothetical protein
VPGVAIGRDGRARVPCPNCGAVREWRPAPSRPPASAGNEASPQRDQQRGGGLPGPASPRNFGPTRTGTAEGGIRTADQGLMSFLSLRTRDFGVSGQFLGQARPVTPNSPLSSVSWSHSLGRSPLVTVLWSGLLLLPSVRIQRVPDPPDSLGERGTPPRGIKDFWRPTCEPDSRPVIQRQSSTAYTSGRS